MIFTLLYIYLIHCFLDEIATWLLTGAVSLIIIIIVLISLLLAYCLYKKYQGYQCLDDRQCCCWRR